MTRHQSAIVIGGGHNGLICAAYLARAGYQVEVLEARESPGGGASTETIAPDYRVSGLAHLAYSLDPDLCKDLGVEPVASHPVDTVLLDRSGQHLVMGANTVEGPGLDQADIDAFRRFKEQFRDYAAALEPLMGTAPPRLKNMPRADKFTLAKLGWKLRFGLGVDAMQEFLRVGGINIYDVLNETFRDDRLKGGIALDAVLGHHMGPRTPNTVLTYLNRLRNELHGTMTLPAGGMGAVGDALARAAVNSGASIRTGERVERILVDDGAAKGVALASGETLTADIVVSNAGAKSTFLEMVGARELDAMFTHRINKIRAWGNVAKLQLALNGLPEGRGLDKHKLGQRLLVAPDMRYVEHAFNHAKYGECSEHPVLEVTIPSLGDPSMAPEGHHVMSVSASFAPYRLKGNWESERERFADKIVATLEQYLPGLSSLIVHREFLSPVDIESRYNVPGGHWHHGEISIDQAFMMRPVHGCAQYNTPIDGLFLCGAAAHPGGGINGTAGRNAAARILSLTGGNGS